MRHILFFATKEDLLPVFQSAEKGEPLKYVHTGNFTKPDLEVFLHGAEIPDLGKATFESAIASASYLVCARASDVDVRRFKGAKDEDRFCVDQLLNPDTVTITPAGMWKDEIVLYGRVATASNSEISQRLMKRFHAAIKQQFTKIKEYYVGANARKLLEAGNRLTIAAQSPREFDLTVD